jgi:CDP-diacylglycerol--glycerol-3-phosphate 3-phosphatidyltransferase
MPLTLASRITLARILCVPLFVLVMIYYSRSSKDTNLHEILRWAASALFLVTFLSDALDGYIARSRKQISKLGTILDPLADKALLLSGLVLLAGPAAAAFELRLPVWFVILVITRDAILVLGSLIIYYMAGDVTVRPRLTGKCATFFQMLLIAWILVGLPPQGFAPVMGLAALFTFASGIHYLIDGARQIDIGQKGRSA